MKIYKSVAIIGDSIYKGTTISPDGTRKFYTDDKYLSNLQETYGTVFFNFSSYGLTTQKVIERKIHIRAVSGSPAPEIALLSLGGNDCNFNWKSVSDNCDGTNYPALREEIYYKNIKIIIEEIKNKGVTPFAVSLVPLHTERYFETISTFGDAQNILKWLKHKQVLYMWQEHYNDILRQASDETGVKFIDIRSVFLTSKDLDALYSADGIHLSQEGYKLLVDTLVVKMQNVN